MTELLRDPWRRTREEEIEISKLLKKTSYSRVKRCYKCGTHTRMKDFKKRYRCYLCWLRTPLAIKVLFSIDELRKDYWSSELSA